MGEDRFSVTIPQAAVLMGLSRSQAWRRLTAIHARHPELRLLSYPCHDGQRRRVPRVNLRVLRRIILDEDGLMLQDVVARVGIIESDMVTTRLRIGRVEKETMSLKTSGFVA